jgi:hypothetical protein
METKNTVSTTEYFSLDQWLTESEAKNVMKT